MKRAFLAWRWCPQDEELGRFLGGGLKVFGGLWGFRGDFWGEKEGVGSPPRFTLSRSEPGKALLGVGEVFWVRGDFGGGVEDFWGEKGIFIAFPSPKGNGLIPRSEPEKFFGGGGSGRWGGVSLG